MPRVVLGFPPVDSRLPGDCPCRVLLARPTTHAITLRYDGRTTLTLPETPYTLCVYVRVT